MDVRNKNSKHNYQSMHKQGLRTDNSFINNAGVISIRTDTYIMKSNCQLCVILFNQLKSEKP